MSGSNSTTLPRRASDQPCGLSLSARETPTTVPSLSGGVPFLSAACERVEQHGPATQGERYAVCGYCLCVKKGNCRTVFFVRKLLLFICCAPCVRRQFRSALFRPRSRAFLPAVFVAAVLPGFSVTGRLFCRKVVLIPGKRLPERCSGHLFCCFLPILQCFL